MRWYMPPLLGIVACLFSCRPVKKEEEPKEPEIVTSIASPPPRDLIALYRFLDQSHNEHVYTYGEGEPRDWRKNHAFVGEAVVGLATCTPQRDTIPLYRAYCRDSRHYFYLAKPAGATDIERMEAFELHVWSEAGEGRIPIHACFLLDDKDAYFDKNLELVKIRAETFANPKRKVVEAFFYLYPEPAKAGPTIVVPNPLFPSEKLEITPKTGQKAQ
jgi:hypothetical protein